MVGLACSLGVVWVYYLVLVEFWWLVVLRVCGVCVDLFFSRVGVGCFPGFGFGGFDCCGMGTVLGVAVYWFVDNWLIVLFCFSFFVCFICLCLWFMFGYLGLFAYVFCLVVVLLVWLFDGVVCWLWCLVCWISCGVVRRGLLLFGLGGWVACCVIVVCIGGLIYLRCGLAVCVLVICVLCCGYIGVYDFCGLIVLV